MRIRTAFCILLTAAAGACNSGNSADHREYSLHGQVISLAPDHKDANIKHDDIKGFMPAMTMPYKVLDTKEYDNLAAGDVIDATLVVVSNDAYLRNVKKVGTAPLPAMPAETSMSASSGFELLKAGQPVPDGKFVDQDGKAVTLAAYRGSVVLVTFMYTSCPMPTFCPLMDRHFAAIQEKLKAKRNQLHAHLLSVSIDPVVDTPAVLKEHAQKLNADPRLWTFLTGDRDDLDQWGAGFGVSVSRALNDPKDITHNLRTAIIDRQGNLVQTYTGNEWTPEQVLADAEVMVGVD